MNHFPARKAIRRKQTRNNIVNRRFTGRELKTSEAEDDDETERKTKWLI